MKTYTFSALELAIYGALKRADRWITEQDIAEELSRFYGEPPVNEIKEALHRMAERELVVGDHRPRWSAPLVGCEE